MNTVTVMSVSVSPQVSNVNPEELGRVLDALRTIDPQARLACSPERLAGGFWAELWILTVHESAPALPHRLVLRLSPDPALGARETVVQRGVAEQGYPTPSIIASGDATETTRFFSLMQLVEGQPLLAGLSGLKAATRYPQLARSVPDQLAQVSAALHALDPAPIEHDVITLSTHRVGAGEGAGALLEHFADVSSQLGGPLLQQTVDRLRADAAPPTRRVVCHGDLHPFNVLSDHGSLTVLDWTGALIADPAYDVAFTALLIANPPLAAPAVVQPVIRTMAGAMARRFVRSYDAVTGATINPSQFDWHTRLHALRILVDLTTWRADGTIDQHDGHPWLAMEPAIRALLT